MYAVSGPFWLLAPDTVLQTMHRSEAQINGLSRTCLPRPTWSDSQTNPLSLSDTTFTSIPWKLFWGVLLCHLCWQMFVSAFSVRPVMRQVVIYSTSCIIVSAIQPWHCRLRLLQLDLQSFTRNQVDNLSRIWSHRVQIGHGFCISPDWRVSLFSLEWTNCETFSRSSLTSVRF